MNPSRRPLAVALAASAFYAGVFVTAAHAEMHYVRVTLVTGQQLTITVEIPPGTPVDQLQIPGLPAPVSSIVDLGSTETHAHADGDRGADGHRHADRHADAPTRHAREPEGRRRQDRSTKASDKVDKTKAQGRGDGRRGDQQATGGEANTESLTGKVEEPRRRRRRRRRRRDDASADTRARARTTRPTRSPSPAPPRSASRTSSSTASGSRRSCCRSTRPRARSTASAGSCWPRSTRSRPTTAAT